MAKKAGETVNFKNIKFAENARKRLFFIFVVTISKVRKDWSEGSNVVVYWVGVRVGAENGSNRVLNYPLKKALIVARFPLALSFCKL